MYRLNIPNILQNVGTYYLVYKNPGKYEFVYITVSELNINILYSSIYTYIIPIHCFT